MTRYLLFMAAASILSGCSGLRIDQQFHAAETDWPSFGRTPQRTNLAADTLVPPLTLAWEQDITGGIGRGAVLAVDSLVIAGNLRGELYVINMNSGKRLGWVDLGEAIEGAPVIDGSVAVVACANTRESLVAYDLEEGRALWKKQCGDIEVSPVLRNGRVFVGNVEGVFRAIDRTSGDEIWKFTIPDNTKLKGIRSSPATDDSTVVFGADDGMVYALNAANGALRWKTALHDVVSGSPAIAGTAVFIGDYAGWMTCLDLNSGKVLWSRDLRAAIYANPAVDRDRVIIGTTGGTLFALARNNGSVVWEQHLEGVINAGAVISGSTVYVGTLRKKLVALDIATGTVTWSYETSGRIKTSPSITRGRLFVATDDRLILAFTPSL